MKLKTKIQLFSTLFMLVIVVLVNASIYFLFYKITTDNEKDALQEQTNTIVETIKDSPDLSKSGLLHAFLPSNGIIRVVSAEGEELIPTIAKNAQYRHLDLIFTTKEIQEIIKSPTGERVAVVSKPIIWEDGQIATLQVANYLLSVEETMNTLFYVLIFASLMIVIPTFIGGNLLSKFVLAPIKELIMTMKANTEPGKWKTIEQNKRSRDEIYEMEETFNDMIDHLKDTFEKQEIFVSDASHELKTPLTSLSILLENMRNNIGKYENRDYYLGQASEMVMASTKMVQNILNTSKLQTIAQEEDKENVDVREVLTETIASYEILAKAKDIQVLVEVEETCFICMNKEALEKVFSNIIANAIHYTDQGKQIRIQMLDGQISIENECVPLSDAVLSQVFKAFYRPDFSRNKKDGGTGLGLYIVQDILTHESIDFSFTRSDIGMKFILVCPNKTREK